MAASAYGPGSRVGAEQGGEAARAGAAGGEGSSSSSRRAHKSPVRRGKPGRQQGARFGLAVLTAINLLNYVDR